jgi:enoyl-CoA hydratase/carnithine racemase
MPVPFAHDDLLLSRHPEGVLEVVINRPERMNALSAKVKSGLTEVFSAANDDHGIASIILRGAGDRAFAAGQDLAEAKDFSPDVISSWIDSFHELYSSVLHCEKPTIAAVNGYAVGAGFQLAMLCDLRIAGDSARFGMPEVDDAIPCITGTWTLYDTLGHSRTADLVLTGRMIDAEEARSWGIVREVVDHAVLPSRAVELATALAQKPAIALRLNKARLRWLLERERESAEAFARTAHREAYETGLPQQKMADFLARRREGRSA